MDLPRDSSLRGRGLMGGRSPTPQSSLIQTLVSPKMDHSPTSPHYVAGSPLLGESPSGIPRSPVSPMGILVKSEPPVSPSGTSEFQVKPKKPRSDGERVEWAPSPGGMSLDSLSPPPQGSNGIGSSMGHPSSGMSPMSTSSYDPSSPYLSKSGQWPRSPSLACSTS